MTSNVLEELISYTKAHAGQAVSRVNEFFTAYFDNAAPGEIAARGPANL